jgi:hypothetical protein
MNISLFTLRFAGGNSFFARVDGKLMSIVDAFCVLESGLLPVCVGMCSIAAKIQFDRAEAGPKQISISFADDSTRPVIPNLETTLHVKIPDHAATTEVPVAFLIKQLSLPAFGEYTVALAVDNHPVASTTLHVRQKVTT